MPRKWRLNIGKRAKALGWVRLFNYFDTQDYVTTFDGMLINICINIEVLAFFGYLAFWTVAGWNQT